MNGDLEEHLAGFVDDRSLGAIVAALVRICHAKAEAARTADGVSWSVAAARLERAGMTIERLGI
jgi:hypothetical protein